MANERHLAILEKGVEAWNKYRKDNSSIKPDLGGADLRGASLREAHIVGANLVGANLFEANLSLADLSEANLSRADLTQTILVRVRLFDARLYDCWIYGVSAWDLEGLEEVAEQKNFRITPLGEPEVTVDDLEVAQFIYLMLHNKKIRKVLDTVTGKVVLILGRFTPERKAILDAIREELRKRNYLPILFDFDKQASRDVIETVSTLAHMSRFIVADLTDAKSVPQELQSTIPNLPSVPVQPILLASAKEYGVFEHCEMYDWVLKTHRYNDLTDLLNQFAAKVIEPAEEKAKIQQKSCLR